MKVKITVSYDGTDYCGWQIQPNQKTVQGEIESAIKALTGESVAILGSGRTDAGVHAICQTAAFDLPKDFPLNAIKKGLNFYLNQDIRVLSAEAAGENFHAIASAKSKTYKYRFYFSEDENPLLKNRALMVKPCDLALMEAAAGEFVGTNDFSPFMSGGSGAKNTVRTVTECRIECIDGFFGREYALIISANGFLYNMVRKIMGLILSIASGKTDLSAVKNHLNNKIFSKETAPPQGLYLIKAQY